MRNSRLYLTYYWIHESFQTHSRTELHQIEALIFNLGDGGVTQQSRKGSTLISVSRRDEP